MSQEKYVAYLDILGFKQLVDNNSHERIFELYDKVFTDVFTHALVHGQLQLGYNGGEPIFFYEPKSIEVNSMIISDSIILWTNDASVSSFIQMITTVKYVLNYMFKTGVPLRGAIVKGYLDKITKTLESSRDNSVTTLIGSGLVNAYLLEAQQDWSGCMIDSNCIDHFQKIVYQGVTPEKAPHVDFLIEQKLLAYYPVPKKRKNADTDTGQFTENEYVVDWVTMGHEFVAPSTTRSVFSQYNKDKQEKNVENIIRNTVVFIETIMGEF